MPTTRMNSRHTDVAIIGSGLAALHCIRHLNPAWRVDLLSKSSLHHSNSYRAQGGVAAVLDNAPNDSLYLHAHDTLLAGEHHHNHPAVDVLVGDGAQQLQQLLADGFHVDTTPQGQVKLGLEGAHSRARIVHAGGDATGRRLIEYYLQHMPANVHCHPHWHAFELLLHHGRCIGVRGRLANGEIQTVYARAVILASGGAGHLYQYTTADASVCGEGLAMAALAGARLTDLEFVQFHPTLLYINQRSVGLLSEAIRGAGARLVNQHGQPIMAGIHPQTDLAPRHITAQQIYARRALGDEVFLDITPVANFAHHFPSAAALCQHHGLEWRQGRLPVAPGCHFSMGGVITDLDGQTSIPGLYAVGEVAHTGVHGANRLASNSLLECLAFGHRLANWLNHHMPAAPAGIADTHPHRPMPSNLLNSTDLRRLMMANAGIVRTTEQLNAAAERLLPLHNLQAVDLSTQSAEHQTRFLMNVTASLIVHACLRRPESRGAHFMQSCPHSLPEWRQRWLVWQSGQFTIENLA